MTQQTEQNEHSNGGKEPPERLIIFLRNKIIFIKKKHIFDEKLLHFEKKLLLGCPNWRGGRAEIQTMPGFKLLFFSAPYPYCAKGDFFIL